MPDGTVVTAVIDGTAEGLFTAVYRYYYGKLRPGYVQDGSLPSFQQAIGADYVFVETDREQAEKVAEAIETKLGGDTQFNISAALSSASPDRFYDVFRYIILAFKEPKNVDAWEQLDYVMSVHKLRRHAAMEAHLLKGFVRFRQTSQGVLYADISPKDNVLWMVCDHFTDRLCNERFVAAPASVRVEAAARR